jgi:hypothetical protein
MTEELKNAIIDNKDNLIGKKVVSFKNGNDRFLKENLEDFPLDSQLRLAIAGLILGTGIESYKLVNRQFKNMVGFDATTEYSGTGDDAGKFTERGVNKLADELKRGYDNMIALMNASAGTFRVVKTDNFVRASQKIRRISGMEREEEVFTLLDNLRTINQESKIKGKIDSPFFEILDAKSKTNRDSIYNHWERVYEDFKLRGGTTESEYDSILEQMGMNFELTDEEKTKLSRIRLPVYILEFPQVSVFQYSDRKTAIGLLNDFVSSPTVLGKTLEEFKELFFDDSEAELAPIGQTQEQQQQRGFEFSVSDLASSVEEEVTIEVDKDADPLYILESLRENELFLVDENVLNVIKQAFLEVQRKFGFSKAMKDVLADTFKNYVKEINRGIINQEKYYLPILDNNISLINKFQRREARDFSPLEYEYKYLEINMDGDSPDIQMVESGEMYSYGAICQKINNDATRAFKTLLSMLERQPRTILGRSRGQSTRAVGSQTGYLAGVGANITGITQESDFVSEYVKYLVKEVIKPLYVDQLSGRYFFGKDLPEYAESDSFKQIKDYAGKSVGRQVRTMGISIIDKEDLERLIVFFRRYKEYSTTKVETLFGVFENAAEVFNKIASISANGDRAEKTKYNDNIQEALGKMLYDIHEAQGIDASQINDAFIDKPLSRYGSSTKDDGELIDLLLEILYDKDFELYASREGGDKGGMKNQLSKLREVLSQGLLTRVYEEKMSISKSYTIATDMLRKSKGLKMYKAFFDINNVDDVDYVIDLIYKEDRVDIYAHDIETILSLNISNDTMASGVGLNPQVIYKIKGLFR